MYLFVLTYCFTREVREAIHETLHKKKRCWAYQSRTQDIILYRKKLKLKTSDFLSNNNPKTLKFENTSASLNNWKTGIRDVKKLCSKSSQPYSHMNWLEFQIDWTNAIYTKGMVSAPNKPAPTNHLVLAETLHR